MNTTITTKQIGEILNTSTKNVAPFCTRNKIKKLDKGLWDRVQFELILKDMQERKKINPPKWVYHGGGNP